MGQRILDHYTKAILTVIALALLAVVVRPLVGVPRVEATLGDLLKDSPGLTGEKVTVTIPRAWGRFVGLFDHKLYFEAADGTIRLQSPGCPLCNVEYVRK